MIFSKYKSLLHDQWIWDHMSGEQQDNLTKLKTDLDAITAKSDLTQEMVGDFVGAVQTLVDGAQRAPEEMKALLTDLSEPLEDRSLTLEEKLLIKADIDELLAAANIPREEIEEVVNMFEAFATASNVTREAVELIIDDIRAIAETFNDRWTRT